MTPPNRLRRLLPSLLAVLVSAFISLAMTQVSPGLGADFVGRWLVGWASLAIWALPIAWLLTARKPGLATRSRQPGHPAVGMPEGR